MNVRYVNTVEYSSESSDNEDADMCVAEWSWGSKSKPFVCSSLKPTSKNDKMRCATRLTLLSVISLTTCCRKSKLNCKVVMSYRLWNNLKSMRIANGIILILMLLMIAMFSVDSFNRP
jgi:hypothetical protein